VCLNFLDLDGTAQQTGSASGDETDFLTGDGRASDSGSLSDVLMVTTTVRMVDGVHSHTTSARPAVEGAISHDLIDQDQGKHTCNAWP
jgi:hypothetical protein